MGDRQQSQSRELLAFGRPIDWENEGKLGTVFFGTKKGDEFPPLPIGNAKDLMREGFLDREARHNDAPPAGELVDWAERIRDKYRSSQIEIGLIGYMVGPHRQDSRIRLNGVAIRSPGPLPEPLKKEGASELDPDLLSVNTHHLEILWD